MEGLNSMKKKRRQRDHKGRLGIRSPIMTGSDEGDRGAILGTSLYPPGGGNLVIRSVLFFSREAEFLFNK